MNLPQRTLDYLSRPTPEGQRNAELFDAACQFRDAGASEHEALRELEACARRDGLAESEARKTIHSVFSQQKRQALASKSTYKRSQHAGGINMPPGGSSTAPRPSSTAKHYDLSFIEENIPDPIPDGTRQFLSAAFKSGEGVALSIGCNDETGHERPKDEGVVLKLEEWQKKLDKAVGDPNKFLKNTDHNGIYIRVNPVQGKGAKDSDVTAFRHALIEWDKIPIEQQWALIKQSNIPCTAVISSGGKSVHAWVRIDAKDRQQYDERVKALYDHFAEYQPDIQNKNPSRFSRLPNCERGKKRQELLALHIGAPSFQEWLIEQEVAGIGETVTVEQLLTFDTTTDDNSVLGKRWLCRGGSCLFIGQSGIGKSALAVQMAVLWAIGRECWGIKPVKPLKSVFVQAENDRGDLAEMIQGVITGLDIGKDTVAMSLLKSNLIFVRDNTHTGLEFCNAVSKLIAKYKPDIFWIDPLLAFVGDDISRQDVCGRFLRNWLNPISDSTGVIWMMVHHTSKPLHDPKANKHWLSTDYSYAGAGSAELTNWARAVCTLRKHDETTFELKLAKRGKRANACGRDLRSTNSIWLQHAPSGICWIQVEEPEQKKPEPKKTAKESQPAEEEDGKEFNADEFMAGHAGETLKATPIINLIKHEYGKSHGTATTRWNTHVKPKMIYDSSKNSYTFPPLSQSASEPF